MAVKSFTYALGRADQVQVPMNIAQQYWLNLPHLIKHVSSQGWQSRDLALEFYALTPLSQRPLLAHYLALRVETLLTSSRCE